TIMEAADRAQELVRQILVMSRKAGTETAPIRMSEVVEEALRLMAATLPGTIKIDTDLRTNALVLANGSQLHQVVTNLCTNAGHAMRRKGGILQVKLRELELGEGDLELYQDLSAGLYVVLEVRDTGPGIPETVRNRIFDPFFTTKAPGEGSGIGLSVVHSVVVAAGGTVTVDTEIGIGSIFRVFWPVAAGAELQTQRADSSTVEGRESIIFVDDEPMQADLAERMLGKMGFRVQAFTDGYKALDCFKADPAGFDLLITDLAMPGLTGEALVEEVLRIRPGFPIVVCSGHFEQDVEEDGLAVGIRRYLLKPLRWRSIAEAIREVLDEE
ncbi:MAG: response regulator, partial [Myxococcota bacterium]|nr:response regulator [Myxococcota bacterium]